jgi:hypothetical protein
MRSSVPWSAGESGTALGVSEIERQRHEPPTSETRPGPDLFGNAKFELIFNLVPDNDRRYVEVLPNCLKIVDVD